ncbi:hypothetical protein [Aquimarina sp. AU119]|uniref:hypothetical protein n=1 Tax=Aquimarina sp. AU119 TaxID=2108528 RepID=UPI000D699237|nr:hypothetical protein [Aquimarina sp. AU119]
MNSDVISVKAKLTLYSTKNGGRKTPIATEYRPNHVMEYFPNSNEFPTTYIGQIEFDKELIYPGEIEHVIVRFLRHQNIEELLVKGRIWWIHEGPGKIGEAEIIKIINE